MPKQPKDYVETDIEVCEPWAKTYWLQYALTLYVLGGMTGFLFCHLLEVWK